MSSQSLYLLDITTGAVKEVINYLQKTVEETQTLRMLPHCGQRLPLKDIYIPVKVSQKRIQSFAQQRAEEINRRHGQPEQPTKAYEHRSEEAFRRLAEKTEEVVLQWENARKTYNKVVVLGDPGQGKTTLLTWERWKTASESLDKLNRQETGLSGIEVPIYVRLAEVASSGLDIAAYIFERLQDRTASPTFLNWLKGAMDRGQVVFLIDALDEVHQKEKKTRIKDELDILLARYPKCRYVLTSRIAGYTNSPVEQKGKALELVKLGPKEVESFAQAWFAADETNRAGFLSALRNNASLTDLGRNPLLLSLLCSVYQPNGQLVSRTTDLYDRCLRNFMVDWRQARGQTVSDSYTMLKRRTLEEAAFILFCSGKEYFSHDELFDALDSATKELSKNDSNYDSLRQALTAKEKEKSLIHELSEEDGILVRAGMEDSNVPYMFLQFTFQEFQAAAAIAKRVNDNGWRVKVNVGRKQVRVKKLIHKKSWDPAWQEVIALLAGQLDDPTKLLKVIHGPRTDDFLGHRLSMAGACFRELAVTTAGALRRQIADEISERWWIQLHQYGRIFPHIERALPAVADISETVPEILCQRLKNEDSNVRSNAAEALGRMGQAAANHPEVIPALLASLRDEDRHVRSRAAVALGNMGQAAASHPGVIPALLALLHDEDGLVCLRAAGALGHMGEAAANHPGVIPSLLSSLRDENEHVRFSAAIALGKMGQATTGHPEVIPALLASLRDEGSIVRSSAAEALGNMGQAAANQPAVIPSLLAWLRDEDEYMRSSAAEALGKMGQATTGHPEVIPALLASLRDEGSIVRSSAAEALGKMGQATTGHPEVIPALLASLRDEGSIVRSSAAYALGQIGEAAANHPDVIPALLASLKEGHVRSRAAYALGQIGEAAANHPEVIPALVDFLFAWDRGVRDSAAEALEKMGVRVIGRRFWWWPTWWTVVELSKLLEAMALRKGLKAPRPLENPPEFFFSLRQAEVRNQRVIERLWRPTWKTVEELSKL